MSLTIEKPTETREDISGLPQSVSLIDMGGGKYACVNATVPDPVEGDLTCGFLAVFVDEPSIETFKNQYPALSYGRVVEVDLDKALEIATSKLPKVRGLALQKGGNTVHPLRFVG